MSTLEVLRQAEQQFKGGDKLNVQLVDQVVQIMNNGVGEEQRAANIILTELKKDPNSWTKVDAILQFSTLVQSKYFALQILEDVISTRWKTLPLEQRDGIRNFIVQHILELSGSAETLAREQVFIQKLNLVLVQIVKQDWPKNWPNFIPELVSSSETNTFICTNNMNILSLLSEEVFDFGAQNLTQAKGQHLKTQFCQQFGGIFQLCLTILKTHPTESLVQSTLKTLHRFLDWIPTGYVFDTDIIDVLTGNYLGLATYRCVTLRCLTEIASIDLVDNTNNLDKLKVMFYVTIQEMQRLLGSQLPDLASMYGQGTDEDQTFINTLAQFLCAFFKRRINIVEVKNDVVDRQYADLFHYAVSVLVSISTIEDVEIFKITLDFWNQFTCDLYRESPFGQHMRLFEDNNSRRSIYRKHLSDLRHVVISKMAKPEEVLVVENDQGEVVREAVKDTDSIVLYRTMREVLVYLTHLDRIDTQMQMNQKLAAQVDGTEYTWKNLNTLCWAIGSISGALTEEEEKKFVVNVIRDLLGMVENRRGKDNKAVIASNIMYVVGQYPRFLRAHWKFLKTVINKLFEFMHESHDGVQDMACDTFIKIVIKTKKLLVLVNPGEGRPFVEEIIQNLPATICDLTAAQQNVFYEAVGHIIAVEPSEIQRSDLLNSCMTQVNSKWDFIIRTAGEDVASLGRIETLREIINVFKSNTAVCKSMGTSYLSQMSRIYSDALSVYQILSRELSDAVSTKGEEILRDPCMKCVRTVKREVLILLSTWISQTKEQKLVSQSIIPPLLEAVLRDYQTNVPAAREPKVLSILTDIVNQQGEFIGEHVDTILGAVFECTLDMINKDMEGWPEHRTNFFQLLSALINHSLKVFISMPTNLFQLVIDAIVWAFQHSMRNVAEIGLEIVINMLKQMSDTPTDQFEKQQAFYKMFYMSLLEHVLAVTADSNQVQVAGLMLFAEVMCLLFQAPEYSIKVPLNDANPQQSNIDYIYEYIGNIFENHFSHLNRDQIRVIVKGFFSYNMDVVQMKNHLRDFLIQLKEFIGEDSSDLFLEDRERAIQAAQAVKARSVPGLLGPNEVADADLEMAF